MTCGEVQADLYPLARNELSSDDARAVLDHIAGCPECRRERAALAVTIDVIAESKAAIPPEHLKAAVLGAVEAERLGPALRDAVPAVPDPSLRARVLEDIARARPDARTSRRAVALAVAAGVIVLAVMVAGWLRIRGLEDDVQQLRAATEAAESRFGPTGHELQAFALSGVAGTVEGQLTHYRHDNYRLTLEVGALEPTPPQTYYAVWLRGERGTEPIGTFRLKRPDRFVVNFAAAVDPAEYPEVLVTLEPDDGDPRLTGETIASGTLDTGKVHHGEYEE
jgi:hypothetical protein